MLNSLDYQEKNLEMMKCRENINEAKSGFKWLSSKFLTVFGKGSGRESMVGYWPLFFLVGGYMKDSLKGSMINIQDFSFKLVFKSVPFLPLYFNCPVFTPDDYKLNNN